MATSSVETGSNTNFGVENREWYRSPGWLVALLILACAALWGVVQMSNRSATMTTDPADELGPRDSTTTLPAVPVAP